jgi:hypothetical protein
MSRVIDRANPSSRSPPFGPAELRMLLVLMQALAIVLTWHLWQVRTAVGDAPNLPVIDAHWVELVQFGFGWPLLASLVLALVWPKIGIAAHCLLLVLAIALDQMRIQPEFVSIGILLVGTLPGEGPRRLARCHLISLWFWAGLHKLFSAGYWYDTGPRMWTDTIGGLSREVAVGLAVATAVFELSLGMLACDRRARRYIPWLAALLHLGILVSLIIQRWNPAVWPWNVAVVAAAIELFSQEQEASDRKQETGDNGRWAKWSWRIAAAIALLHPGLYYVGLTDAYLSWCVYSSNTPEAKVYARGADARLDAAIAAGRPLDRSTLDNVLRQAVGQELPFKHYASIKVPFSPAPRLFEQYFRKVGRPGEMLVIHDSRLISVWRKRDRIVLVMTPDRKVVAW